MDSGKRSVQAPARLTYDAMGEPTETRDAGVSGESRAVPNGPPPAIASSSAQVPSVTRSCRSRSSVSVASSKLRDLELDSEEEALKLKHKYEEEIEEIDDEIELLEFNLTDAAPTEETEQLKKRLSVLQLQKKQKSKKLRSAEKRLEETLKFAKKRVETETEDDQRLADVDLIDLEEIEKESHNEATSVWALKASQRPADQVLQGITPEKLQEEMQCLDNVRSWGLGEREPHAQTGPKSAMKKVGLGLPGSDLEDVNRWSTPVGSTTPPTLMRDNKANENQNKPDHGILDLASALKEVLKEVKGEKEWEPKDLPTFSGKPEDWPIFKNEFRRTTPAGKVNSSQNAIRLRKALNGSAMDAVAGMLHEPENVHKILEILEASFGRSDLIIEALIRKAEQVKPPDNSRPENFVNFGRVVQQLVSTAKSMKEERYLNDVGLLNKLVEKLPMTFCREWLSWIGARTRLPHNLASFGDWIDSQMLIMVRIAKPIVREDDDSSNGRTRQNRGSGVIAAASCDDKNPELCIFCEKANHSVASCYKFKRLTLEEKVKFVKEKGLCFRCLSQGHIIRKCSSTQTCNVGDCSKKHHPLLHGGKSWKNKHGAAQADSEEEADLEGETSDSSTTAALKTMSSAIRQSKPLSVVRIRVKGPKGIRKIYAGLDSQSDATVIEDEVCDAIGVTGGYFRHICTGVNGVVMKEKARHLADFQIGGSYPKAQWYDVKGAKTMSKLGLPRYNQNAEKAKENWPYLRKAKLETFSNVKIQMLIGEDHPFLTAHRNILEKGQHDPMAKRTVLGWVLAGKKLATTDSSSIRAIRSNEELDDDGNVDEEEREPGEMKYAPLPVKTEIEELILPGVPLTEGDIDDHFLNRFNSNADGEGKEGDEAHVESLDNSEVDNQDMISPYGRPVRRRNRRRRDSEEDLEDMDWNQKPKKKKLLPPGTARRGGRRQMSRQERAELSRRQKRALMPPEEKEKLREKWKEEARIKREKERKRRAEGKSLQTLERNDVNESVENGRNKRLTRKAKFKALIKEEPASSDENDFENEDDQAVRNNLQKGFIPTVFPGADGPIRLFEVTTVDRNTNRKKTLRLSGQGYSTGTSQGKIGVIPPILRVGM